MSSYLSSISSYFYGGTTNESGAQNKEQAENKKMMEDKEMGINLDKSKSNSNQFEKEETSAGAEQTGGGGLGYMQNLINKGKQGLKMATQMVSPEAQIQLNAPTSGRTFYQSGDEITGVLTIDVPFELQHDGIKLILKGTIQNKSSDMYYGASAFGMLSAGAKYDFMQL